MDYYLYPPFFGVEPQTSFDEAWEVFCCELLNLEHSTQLIRRRTPPDLGADLIWDEKNTIYQCKASEDGQAGSFSTDKAIKSITRALTNQKMLGWQKYILCSNVDITGAAEQKLQKVLPGIEILSRTYWISLCNKFHREVAVTSRFRFSSFSLPKSAMASKTHRQVSSRTHKKLWGRAANRCSFPGCRLELIMDGNENDSASVVGEECHIIAKEQEGPRGSSSLIPKQRDEYENLILLCNIHHKIIDDQPNTYTVERLRTMKETHEKWVRESLSGINQRNSLQGISSSPSITPLVVEKYEYDVALSYASEDRSYVDALANTLVKRDIKVFYDKYEQHTLWGQDLYTYLSELYQNKAHYCIMFLSKHYASKLWTKHERKAAQARAFEEQDVYILPIRLDDTEILGFLPTIAFIDWQKETVEDIANIIIKKLGKENKTDLISVNENKSDWESFKESVFTKLNEYKLTWTFIYGGKDENLIDPLLSDLQKGFILLSREIIPMISKSPQTTPKIFVENVGKIASKISELGRKQFYMDGGISVKEFNKLGDEIIRDIENIMN